MVAVLSLVVVAVTAGLNVYDCILDMFPLVFGICQQDRGSHSREFDICEFFGMWDIVQLRPSHKALFLTTGCCNTHTLKGKGKKYIQYFTEVFLAFLLTGLLTHSTPVVFTWLKSPSFSAFDGSP